jgi:hypothetical protein
MKDVGIAAVVAFLLCVPAGGLADAPVQTGTGPAATVPTGSASAAATPADVAEADASPTVMAVWVEKKISFAYMGFTAYYSCDGLRYKVKAILEEIGVRPGFKIQARGCVHLSGPEDMPMLEIVAATPREATPEVLAELEKDAAKRELVSRYGTEDAAATEATAQFPARVRRIDFRDSATGLVQAGDCELVEQLRDRVFVPLGAKVVVDRMGCVPRQLNIGIINLSIEMLEPVPQQ